MHRFSLLLSLVAFFYSALGQSTKPKLVVGVVVDQMRQEYLYRYQDRFVEGGFKRLMKEGFVCQNAHYNYIPTNTGPGHAAIYTGATPGIHGVLSNDWYDRFSQKEVNCVGDERQSTLGASNDSGKKSPHRMRTSTITDELRISTQFQSKVIGISLKDRGAILPAGHSANAAYWYDSKTGNFVSSSYYLEKLPEWVNKFNKRKLAENFLKGTWEPLYPIETYTRSGPDDSPYEERFKGKQRAVFPYNLKELAKTNGGFELLRETPFGNELVYEMAIAALREESLGKGLFTDFLAVSFSATDVMGHKFGPQSVELEDVYLRMDQLISSLLTTLDQELGQGAYTLFLTSDHGVVDVPQFLVDRKMPGGLFRPSRSFDIIQEFLNQKYGEGPWVVNGSNYQIFLNRPLIWERGIDIRQMQWEVSRLILELDGVAYSYPAYMMEEGDFNEGGIKGMLIRGYHPKLSGDVLFGPFPGYLLRSSPMGTNHGSGYTYDTHVPIMFFGHGVTSGSTTRPVAITDIAPTLAMMLQITLPNGANGIPIGELLKK
jgi:predicted AlkP superfamily pyrophosphatase or phosphodiesterase